MTSNTSDQKIERIKEILQMQKVLMMEHNGRPDCKNCALAETIEEILEKDDE